MLVSVWLAGVSLAVSGPGVAGGPLIGQPVGARPLALGSSYTALADDALSLFWNPSGLAHLRTSECLLAWQREPGEVDYGFIGYARPLVAGHSAAVAVGTLRTGDIEYDDPAGVPTTTAGESDVLMALGYGVSLVPMFAAPDPSSFSLSAGLTTKYLHAALGEGLTDGVPAADIGATVTMPVIGGGLPLRIGVVWQNAGARLESGGGTAPVASPVRVGLAQTLREGAGTWTTVTADAVRYAARGRVEGGVGVEQVWRGERLGVAGRFGYRANTDLPGLTAGLGLRWDRFVFDYGFARLAELGGVHRVSLRVRLP